MAQEAPELAYLEDEPVDLLGMKRDLMRLMRGLLNLEQRLLYPYGGQLVLLLGLDSGAPAPSRIDIKVNGKLALSKRFSQGEQRRLRQAAIFPALTGHWPEGKHQVSAVVTTAKG
ncbi:MAG: hypothetical protein GWN58_42695, partial [Anaerolineae bacterium]|nr:hypothetical protein [Anaerolineae bacterium]